jgi:hypothetical protein
MSLHYLTHAANYAALYTVAASEASSVYPIANIKNDRLADVWRSNGGLSNVDITVDLGAARNVNLAGLANHNFTSAVTLAIAAGTTVAVSDFSDTIAYRESSAYKILSATQNYRYWRIRITDASNPAGYLEAGYLLLGLTVTPSKSIAADPGIQQEDESLNHEVLSEFGSPSVDFINERARITLRWAALNNTDRTSVLDFIKPLRQRANPLFLIPNTLRYDGWYVRLQTHPSYQDNSLVTDLAPLTFFEDGRGKRMAA